MSSPPPSHIPPASSRGKPPVSAHMHKLLPATPGNRRNSEESFLDDEDAGPGPFLEIDDAMTNKESEPMSPYSRNPKRFTRDSHDLSFPARQITRDSLVTNMLNSLDQFSLGQISTPTRLMFDDNDNYASSRVDDYSRSISIGTNARATRGRANNSGSNPGHGYSYSSDLEGTDETSSRVSSQFSRGRRSNSGSGFQSGLARLSSLKERSRSGHPKRPMHSRGGKTSKSSSSNSIDAGYAQVLTTQRIAHGIGGRSSSLDYGTRPALNPPVSAGAWNAEFTNTFLNEDYEAAPTPSVPVGRRRPPTMPSSAAQQPASSSTVPMLDSEVTPADRKGSMQSRSGLRSRGGTGGKSTRSSFGQSRDIPPVPPLDMDSAPAPNVGYVGYDKVKEALRAAPVAASQPKERPGFFKRVFWGARNTLTSSAAPVVPETPEQTGNKTQHNASQAKSSSTPPSRDSQQGPQHVVQKKSSFFRRRKKSFNEPPLPTPPVPPLVDGNLTVRSAAKPDPSPASSLCEIMRPYLKDDSALPTQEKALPPLQRDGPSAYDSENDESRRRVRGFSPDYEPSPNATIRTVKSQSAIFTQRQAHAETPGRRPLDVPSRQPSKAADATFFHDSSDDGERHGDADRSRSSRRQSGKPSPTTSVSDQQAGSRRGSLKPEMSPKLPLQPNAAPDNERRRRNLMPPSDGSQTSGRRSVSADSRLRSATSMPSVRVDPADISSNITGGSPLDEPHVTVGEPTEDDRQKARQIFDGNEQFIQKEKAAAWMGEEGLVRQRTLRAYMDLYDFANQSVLSALRQICTRLVLRAETQQVDRILVAFSNRWCDCNPNHGFKSMDVIHTLCYSIMLLNTDLHMADIEHKMTRSQFVKNTIGTIRQAVEDYDPGTFERGSILPGKSSLLSPGESENRASVEQEQDHRSTWRSSFKPLPRSESALGNYFCSNPPVDSCGPLVKTPFEGTMKAWEAQVELVLKDVYESIRDEKLPLFGAEAGQSPGPQGGLSVMGMLKRSPSVLSKAPSEGQISARGRMNDPNRINAAGRWASKSRSRPRLGNGFSSSRTSFEDGSSIWSPTGSSATWSRYSLGRTQTSMSIDSFGSAQPHGGYQQSIGFANALSQAIIREDLPPGSSGQSIMSEEFQSTQLLEDESLELAGPPWIKEGILIHKHHLDGIDKKAKDRNWAEVFAVIQKGTLSLFSFSTKSMRQKARGGKKAIGPGTVVGGGNWQDNATSVGTFSLRQTLASALPPPGYSRTRPHVWALSLPTGAVHLFQVGTPEVSKEFVITVNYWSARLSTHPLMGGVSNIEYGWSDAIINTALVSAMNEQLPNPPRPGSAAAGRTSLHSRQGSRQSSLRSSFDMGTGSRAKLPGDKVTISDWAPPSQSMRPSNLEESEQLETLMNYVKSIEEDLQQHNQLRSPMLLAFTPRGHNAAKAMANWERKSSYLLREIVKFRTYVDCLQHAEARKAEIYAERENARRAARGEDLSDDASIAEGDLTLKAD
ncbi:hypothetical protein DL764_000941 [Monosporascus ibericus]|uniref:SEC7 domain-containing protein n=1 Tax=Monosporascus ibericus TaxID=155417 RepID=A0A4Q4TTA0_9PEZI|nr:hypothetical protein DL764_000941 [Monosporascus ibericus]